MKEHYTKIGEDHVLFQPFEQKNQAFTSSLILLRVSEGHKFFPSKRSISAFPNMQSIQGNILAISEGNDEDLLALRL